MTEKVECHQCNRSVARLTRFCPDCRAELGWDKSLIGSDAEEGDGEYAGWATSNRFSFSPWTGVEYDGAPHQPVKSAKGFTLDHACADCDGNIERYMNYCPSCGWEPCWPREPGKRWLADALLDGDCDKCGWEISSLWQYCPWCGDERYELDPAIEINLRRLAELEYDAAAQLLRRLVIVAEEVDDYAHPAIELRKILEAFVDDKCAEYDLNLSKLSSFNAKLAALKDADMIHPREKRLAEDVASLGNKAAHPNGPIRKEDLIADLGRLVSLFETLA